MAAATLVEPGERVLVCGGAGHHRGGRGPGRDARRRRRPGGVGADVVMVGFHRDFDYERLRIARDGRARRRPPDRHQRRRDLPDAGRADPRRRGDPRRRARRPPARRRSSPASRTPPMAGAVRATARATSSRDAAADGRRPGDTDGAFAVTLGCPFALVRTGVTPPGRRSTCRWPSTPPTWRAVVDVDPGPADVPG